MLPLELDKILLSYWRDCTLKDRPKVVGRIQYRGIPRRISTMIFLSRRGSCCTFLRLKSLQIRNCIRIIVATALPRAAWCMIQNECYLHVDSIPIHTLSYARNFFFQLDSRGHAYQIARSLLALRVIYPHSHASNQSQAPMVHNTSKQ